MPTTLSYGLAGTCLLEHTEAVHLRPNASDTLSSEAIAGRVQSQLADPLNYPPLSQVMIPGDEIVVVLESGIPQLPRVLDGVLQALAGTGAQPPEITILLPESQSKMSALQDELKELGHEGYHFAVHDPDDEKGIAFLGVSEAGQAIRLNRLLCDADFVLPVGTPHSNRSVDSSSIPEIYPRYSDRETIERMANADASEFPATGRASTREIEECGWQLGAQLHLQIVPHGNGQIANILAGETTAVLREAEAAYQSIWRTDSETQGSLVIATITGDQEQQTWQNLGRAIAAAQPLLETEGSLVIYSELADPPGEATCHLAGNEDPFVVVREIQKTQSADCGPAMVLNRALQRGSLYLRSQLRPSLVESLGMTPLETDSELERLAETIRPCLVLEEAQFMLPQVLEGEHDE